MMKRRKKIGILIVFFCLFSAVFLFSGYQLINNMAKNKAAADAYQELRTELQSSQGSVVPTARVEPAEEAKPLPELPSEPSQPVVSMDFSGLQEINPEIVGWIKGEGTGIDYPVMQADNNSYYLTHLYNGEYNNNGSIFMDYRNSGDFSDKNTVLYGHHMRNGTMFGDLEQYKDQEFFNAHPVMMLYTPGGDYLIELISGTVEDGTYEFVRFDLENNDSFLNYMEGLRSRSTFISDVEVQIDDQIIALCTCTYDWNNARYMVTGRLVPLYQTQQIVIKDTIQKDLP